MRLLVVLLFQCWRSWAPLRFGRILIAIWDDRVNVWLINALAPHINYMEFSLTKVELGSPRRSDMCHASFGHSRGDLRFNYVWLI